MDDISSQTTSKPACVRFGHVDGAGIVFYPRYFEMLARHFDGLSFAAPIHIDAEFRLPNRLGDRIDLTLDTDQANRKWSAVGALDGVVHFHIEATALTKDDYAVDALPGHNGAFRGPAEKIGEWVADRQGNMQLARYYEFVNESVERWFEDILQSDFSDLFFKRRVGIPTVRFSTRCLKLPAVGTVVEMQVRPRRTGHKSLKLTNVLFGDGEAMVVGEQTIVFVAMAEDGQFQSIAIPADIRECIESQFRALSAGNSC